MAFDLTTAADWKGEPAHKALAEAIVTRYEWPVTKGTPKLQLAYKKKMWEVYKLFPEHPIVVAAYVEAVMTLSPWNLYDGRAGGLGCAATPNVSGCEAAVALASGLKACPTHLWLCHLKVHFNEMGCVVGGLLCFPWYDMMYDMYVRIAMRSDREPCRVIPICCPSLNGAS